jgi:hypothetical protein
MARNNHGGDSPKKVNGNLPPNKVTSTTERTGEGPTPKGRGPRAVAKRGGNRVHNRGHHPPHAVVPSWVWAILVNVLVLAVSVGSTWGVMRGDITNMDLRVNSLTAQVSSQATRIDGMVKEQDRITRLEERLGNVATILIEIKNDLREGRYASRKDGSIGPSRP